MLNSPNGSIEPFKKNGLTSIELNAGTLWRSLLAISPSENSRKVAGCA
jgi:hypothetical protein